MPANKKAAKTTKTAHVLNVLTGGQDSGDPAADGATVQPAPAAPKPAVELASPDDELSGRIMNALAEELNESPPPAPIPQPAAPVQQAAPAPAAVRPAVIPEFFEEPAPAAPPPAPAETVPSEYINIVQALVEEKAPKYLEMLGVCKCSRCVADVKALALSNLPPKYIVVHKSQRVPMLTVYEGKYSAAITAQLLSACKTVIANPRH